jgi:hypothetical protein
MARDKAHESRRLFNAVKHHGQDKFRQFQLSQLLPRREFLEEDPCRKKTETRKYIMDVMGGVTH